MSILPQGAPQALPEPSTPPPALALSSVLTAVAVLFGLITDTCAITNIALILGMIVFISWGVSLMSPYFDPAEPRKPRRQVARMASLGPEPPNLIQELADNCTICGRPLTNMDSRIARVGSTCIKTHGPRPRKISNPAHAVWAEVKVKAQADQAAEQARLNVEFDRANSAYIIARAAWSAEKASPAGVRRATLRAPGRRVASSAWFPALGLALHAMLHAAF